MAGDWIKMRIDLHTSPKVVRISSALKTDRLRTVGALHAVWGIFDSHSEDGELVGYSPEILDSMIGFSGFCFELIKCGWLDVSGDSLVMPRFDEHNGKSAKKRAMDSERKRNVRKMSAFEADKNRTREEKRREEKKEIQTLAPANAVAITKPKKQDGRELLDQVQDLLPQVADDYMTARKTKKAGALTSTALAMIEKQAQLANITTAQAIAFAAGKGWVGFNSKWYEKEIHGDTGKTHAERTQDYKDAQAAKFYEPLLTMTDEEKREWGFTV